MLDDTPPPFPETELGAKADASAIMPITQRADGTVVIDLLLPPPPSEECVEEVADPFNPTIVVCRKTTPSQRLGPVVGPLDDGFASAIPRARIKLSDKAAAEANVIKQGVGGFDADGAEVRLKIDF